MIPILPDPDLKHCILINKNLIVTSGSRTSALGTTGARRTLRREWTITNLPHQRGSVKLLKPVLWIQIRIRRFLAGSAIICTDSNSSIKKSKVKFEKFLRFCDFFYLLINFTTGPALETCQASTSPMKEWTSKTNLQPPTSREGTG
jgi:hypothetical protein